MSLAFYFPALLGLPFEQSAAAARRMSFSVYFVLQTTSNYIICL